jgi:hypothetical protein
MTKTTGDAELDRAIDGLFIADDKRPCPVGTALLRDFAVSRPVDFGFLESQDLIDPTNCAFTGIVEWDSFSAHYATCERCNA